MKHKSFTIILLQVQLKITKHVRVIFKVNVNYIDIWVKEKIHINLSFKYLCREPKWISQTIFDTFYSRIRLKLWNF